MDIVERLRNRMTVDFDAEGEIQDVPDKECIEAADEIERLREALRLMPKTITDAANEIERLRDLVEKHINEKSELKRGMIDILEYLSAVQIAEVNIKYIARKALGEIDALKEGE